ncbi:DHHC palmitoyltransferase-domain-containing protein [Radiomyces spectabilis]|uniref:DHHC palmitoyltransferase-domain-containing protein n=1 Tax=Radiomyces spectabilis TaxID=64574 RepID=UPI002220A9C5|nr:DHHC palmitoyltransferase-domain-containing protein [Radiomyces spectabilis]KAI8394128.1 DHHC palmitoyltransferase-domain-containing protein [Radiomyces spectabilis]
MEHNDWVVPLPSDRSRLYPSSSMLGHHPPSSPQPLIATLQQGSSMLHPANEEEPESLETFDFESTPHKPQIYTSSVTDESSVQTFYASQSHEDPVPQSSGVTTLSNATTDDNMTLIGRKVQPVDTKPLATVSTGNKDTTPTNPVTTVADPSLEENTALNATTPSERPTPKRVTNLNRSRSRNYQVFPGRNKFFCGGRLMTSREYWAFSVAMILLVAPCVVFGIFTCPVLWREMHPVVPILFAYFFVLSVASMIKTSWTDPGIIPRGLDPSPMMELTSDQASEDESLWSRSIPAQKIIRIRDTVWTLKYCDTCKIYRPPRASHCRQCDNCVENEDHHCIWLNNCIGKRNYRSFFTCIATSTILCIYVIVFSLVDLLVLKGPGDVRTLFHAAPASFVLAIFCFVLLWLIGGLTFYHCSLVLHGLTTHERLRASILDTKHLMANPYKKKNPFLNMAHVLCRPQPKSYLRRRKYADLDV